MSLTSHLSNAASPIGQYIKQRFASTKGITTEINRQLRQANTIRPVQSEGAYPYQTIGTAIDYRLRYAFTITPYKRFVAWKGATKLAFRPLESDADTAVKIDWDEINGVLLWFDPLVDRVAEGPYPLKFLRTFFDSLDTTVQRIQPVGRHLSSDDEQVLDRYCYVLSLFEQVFRNGTNILQSSPLMPPKRSVEALLAIPQDVCLDDIAAVFSLFYERCNSLLSKPHKLNPTFAGSNDVGGADADLIVDGCLIDIKATITPKLAADHLYQLAGYLLLDYDDALHITSVGIYMARQGMLFTWPVDEFVRQLTGDGDADGRGTIAELRKEFRRKFQR